MGTGCDELRLMKVRGRCPEWKRCTVTMWDCILWHRDDLRYCSGKGRDWADIDWPGPIGEGFMGPVVVVVGAEVVEGGRRRADQEVAAGRRLGGDGAVEAFDFWVWGR